MEVKLRSLVSREEWELYHKNDKAPIGIIMATDFIKGSREFYNLKELDYDTAITLVRASCSIPVFANPVHFEDKVLYDGGCRDHIITSWILDNFDIESTYSIFTRPSDFKDYVTKKDLDNTPKVFSRSFNIMLNEISKTDEELSRGKCEKLNIPYKAYYLDSNPLKNFYDDSPESLKALYNTGTQEVIKKGL